MHLKYFLWVVIFFVTGCSIASINKMQRSSEDINFDDIEKTYNSSSDSNWTWDGKNEYFLFVEKSSDDELIKELKNAATHHGYKILFESENGRAMVGERGLRLHEWYSVLGIYIDPGESYYRLYIKIEITQDITGGPTINRAKEIGDTFCSSTKLCNIKEKST